MSGDSLPADLMWRSPRPFSVYGCTGGGADRAVL